MLVAPAFPKTIFRSCNNKHWRVRLCVPSSDVYVNWTEGEAICRRSHRRAHLVAIETEAEQLYLRDKWMLERGTVVPA